VTDQRPHVSSKRAPSFTVTAAGQKVSLDKTGAAQASFTVTNTSPQDHRGRLLTRPRDPAKPEWFSVVGDAVRSFAPNAAEQVVAQLNVPPGSPPGSYSFRLDAVAEDDPDEDYTEGPSVAFEVAPPPAPGKKKFPWWILIVAAVVLLIVIGVVAWLLLRDRPKAIPSVVGQAPAAAQSTLTTAGFTAKTQQVAVNNPAQNGVVVSQAPAAGTKKKKGTEVTLNVGHMATVPPVRGLPEAAARNALEKAELKADARDAVAPPQQNGVVIDQAPNAGTLLPPGGVVKIAVGRLTIVPNVVGVEVTRAEGVLNNAGLKVTIVRDHRFGVITTIVQDQNPPGGVTVPFGTTVAITIFVP
jgi:eukaryotic-like serine/threonine-protein kinase